VSPIEILLGVTFPILVGIGIALAMGSGSAAEFWVARISFIAAALNITGLIIWWVYNSGLSLSTLTIGALVGACSVVGLPTLLRWIDAKEITATQKPDVKLRFVYPNSPALVLINDSDVVARDIKWFVALWNIDLPSRDDPLPIPVSTFDWLQPNSVSGAQDLFYSPAVVSVLKPGNRLLGSASVSCPTCSRGRTYMVYITWDTNGWYAEVDDIQTGQVVIPSNFLKQTREQYIKLIEAVPTQSRTSIGK
jgi:hypothetical protein